MKVGDLVKMKESPRDNEERDVGIVVDFKPLGELSIVEEIEVPSMKPLAVVVWADFGIAWHKTYNLEILHEVGS